LEAGADYRKTDSHGLDFVLYVGGQMFFLEKYRKPGDGVNRRQIAAIKPVFDWLTNEGVNWQAVRTAGESHLDFKNLPADYQHRPWLPQRPTLKKPDAKPEKRP
jgi:hypothetical protein